MTTERDTMSLKARTFLAALDALCKEHGILLSVSGYDALQVWDLDTTFGESWYCNGLEDMTIPAPWEDVS